MAVSDLFAAAEKKVSEVRDLKAKADLAATASTTANNKLNQAQKELEDLRVSVHEALGNVFTEDSRVRMSK